jgi:formylglycine-generating enzyme required for sulfatase activity
MGIYEVTQGQYRAVMGTNPSDYKGDNLPVHWVIWNDATEFCRKLSQKEGKTYRLPTEEEWEYACRAGTDTKFFFGNEELRLDAFAWYSQNSNGQPHPVGLKNPNAWGLYDMCGNVEEWCENVWPGKNIWINVNANEFHILKGGSWKTGSGNCESASLEKGCPREIQQPYACGFRVVLDF